MLRIVASEAPDRPACLTTSMHEPIGDSRIVAVLQTAPWAGQCDIIIKVAVFQVQTM